MTAFIFVLLAGKKCILIAQFNVNFLVMMYLMQGIYPSVGKSPVGMKSISEG